MATTEPKPLFALCTISHREKLLEYALEVAVALGFDGVELWGREPHISEKFDENRVQAARRMIGDRGLAVPVLASYLTFGRVRTRLEEMVDLEDMLHTARCLRTPVMRVWASDLPSDQASKSVWQRTVGQIQEACDQAARLHLTLAAEMHDATLADTSDSALRLLERVDRENFRLAYGVSARQGAEPPEQRLAKVVDYVVHAHLHNFHACVGPGERPRRASIAEGTVDYFPLLGMLSDHGYRGYYALEFAAQEGDGKRQALSQDLVYLKSLFKLMGKPA